jgi:hypothetical protein
MNNRMQMEEMFGVKFPEPVANMMRLDERVPEFHTEFTREGCWPPGCDPAEGRRVLQCAYEHARGIARMRMHLEQEFQQVSPPADINYCPPSCDMHMFSLPNT